MPTLATLAPHQLGDNTKLEIGEYVTVSASNVVQTKLQRVVAVIITAQDDPAAGASSHTAIPSGAKDGKFTIKAWKPTAAGDTTPVAASVFGKKVTYLAVGN